ncbi:MAG TPA: serine hydrolase domain-containing protein [Chlamydiales bacterium]|nr:serine hydrolase domain-containing protein [Chlamydiales bacterium]
MTTDIQSMLEKTIKKNRAVGAAVGFIEQDQLHFYCSGEKSAQDDVPISIDTIFEIGSITKVFTTLLLIEMVQKGEANLDDPVENFFPSVRIPEFNGKKITLRHLATHHSGLPGMPGNINPKDLMNPYAGYSTEDLYRFLGRFTLKKTPGEQFVYSNLGMALLGHILCLKMKKSYGRLTSDSILSPLSMVDTGADLTPNIRSRMSVGHHLGKMVKYWDVTEAFIGAVGFHSSIKDMTQFLAANLGLLNPPVADLLRRCHKHQYTSNSTEDIGLGWIISHINDADVIWHDGITGGFRSFIGFNPRTQNGIVVLSNSTKDWLNEFSFSILAPNS